MTIKKYFWLYFSFGLFFVVYSSCAKGCGKKSQPEEGKIQELNFTGIVKDEEGNPVDSAIVSVKIDLNGDNIFSPDEIFVTITNNAGFFSIGSEIITSRLLQNQSEMLTGRIITGRIITGRIQVDVAKEGFAKNSFYLDGPGFSDVKLAKTSSAKDSDLRDGAQFALVSSVITARSPILLSDKKAKNARIFAKQEGGEVIAEIEIPAELVSEYKELSASVAFVNPASQPELMPGSFLAYKSESEKGFITLSSAGLLSIELQNEKGEYVSTFAPKIARMKKKQQGEVKKPSLRMKIPEDVYHTLYDYINETTDKVEVPMWYYDEIKGVWIQGEELGILQDENGNIIKPTELVKIVLGKEFKKLYVSAKVEHFSAWNVDYPVDTHAAVGGQVVDENGNPISGLFITTEGNTYGGLGDWKGTYTDDNGNFWVDVKKSEPVHDEPSKGKMFGPYDDYLNDIVDKIPPSTDGGGVNCNDIINQYRRVLANDIKALEDAVFDLYVNKRLIDENTYRVNINALIKARVNLDISLDAKEGFDYALKTISTVQKGLEPIGRASADQIFYERWEEIGNEAKKLLISYTLDVAYGLIDLGDIPCTAKLTNELLGLGLGKDVVNKIASAIATGQDPGEAFQEAFGIGADPYEFSSELLAKMTSTISDCVKSGSAVELNKIQKLRNMLLGTEFNNVGKVAGTSVGNLLFLAQTAGTFGGQAIEAWGEHGEWKSAKAWEMVQPLINQFRKDYNAFLRSQNFIPEQCRELISPFFPFPPLPASPKIQNLGYQNSYFSPRVQVKQSSDEPDYEVYMDDITTFLYMMSSFARFIIRMDEIIAGGASHFGETLWSVKCSFIPDKNYYVCSNSENPMDCSFSSEVSKYVCNPKSDEKVQYVETTSRIVAYVPSPQIKVGGETRSRILIDGQGFDLKTSLGFRLLDIPSPVESSSSHHDLYGWSEVTKKPYLYIGKVVLPIKQIRVKGKLVDEAKKTIPNLQICLRYGRIGRCIFTGQDGVFSVSLPVPVKAEEIVLYIEGQNRPKVISLPPDTRELDLGEIVLFPPVRITGVSIPESVKKGDKGKLSVSYVGGNNPSASWKIYDYYTQRSIGQGDSVEFTFTKSMYVCVYVEDELSQDVRCNWVQVITEKPSISIFANGNELKEGVEYEFEERTYIPLEIKVSDPDSSQEQLIFWSWVDYNEFSFSISSFYRLSPILYSGKVNQDTLAYAYFRVCDEDWNCVQKKISIKVVNKLITPSIKIFPDKVSGYAPLKLGLKIEAKDYRDYVSIDINGDGKEDEKTYSNYVEIQLKDQGDYNIVAKVKSEDGIEASDSVNIKVFPEFKILSFSADKSQVRRKEVVRFEVSTSNKPLVYRWSFGDLAGAETTQNSVTYSYNPRFAGTYYPKVFVITDVGLEIASQPITIEVVNSPPEILSFTASATTGVVPFDVTFSVTAEDDYEVSRYVWTFGDGYKRETTSPTVTHEYGAAGEYTAVVTIYDSDGETATKTLRISVSAQPECDIPEVYLYASPTSGNSPLTVTFQATVTSLFPIVEYRWDFQNDGIIDNVTPSNITQKTYYSSYSTQLTAKVQVVNSCGNSNYATVQIQVNVVRQYHSADYFTPVSTCFPNDGTTFKFINDDRFKIADINGDSIPDIIIGSLVKNSFFVFYGDSGTGTYQFNASYSAITGHSIDYGFSVDDFDGDNRKDVLLFGGSGTDHFLYFYKNDGSSFSFSASTQVNLGSEHCFASDIQSADVNQDGNKDVFVGCSGVSLLARGDGTGSFSSVLTFPDIQGWVRRGKLVDLDKDGRLDIAGVNLDDLYFFVKRNTGSDFDSAITFTLPNSLIPDSLDVEDFDGDGKGEIVIISEDQMLYLYKNNSSPGNITFSLQSTANAQIISPLNNISLEVEDMNSDSIPDIIWTAFLSSGGATHFNLSFGDPTTISSSGGWPREASSYSSRLPYNFGPIGLPDIEVADVNQDGFTDVVLVYFNGIGSGKEFCIFSFIRKTTAPAPRFAYSVRNISGISDKAGFGDGVVGCSVSPLAIISYVFALFFLPYIFFAIFRKRRKRIIN